MRSEVRFAFVLKEATDYYLAVSDNSFVSGSYSFLKSSEYLHNSHRPSFDLHPVLPLVFVLYLPTSRVISELEKMAQKVPERGISVDFKQDSSSGGLLGEVNQPPCPSARITSS